MTKTASLCAGDWKEEGNKYFKSGDYESALECYTKALDISVEKNEKLVFFKNRAACYLKLVSSFFKNTRVLFKIVVECMGLFKKSP